MISLARIEAMNVAWAETGTARATIGINALDGMGDRQWMVYLVSIEEINE